MLPGDIIPGSPMAQQPVIILRDAAGYAVDHDWSSLVTASVIGSNGNLVPLGGKKKQVATPAKNSNYSDHGGRVFFSDLQLFFVVWFAEVLLDFTRMVNSIF